MNRDQLEHIIRAASKISGDDQIVIVGSQAIIGSFPDASGILARSMEADIWARSKPEMSDMIDGSIGEGSRFHELYGYYAQGVSPTTAVLPIGWEGRLNIISTAGGANGYCIDRHDLFLSKAVAWREKDVEFLTAMIEQGLVDRAILLSRISLLPPDSMKPDIVELIEARVRRLWPSEGQE